MGINLVDRKATEAKALNAWYNGPTLVDLLGWYSFSASLLPDSSLPQTSLNLQAETSPARFDSLFRMYSGVHTVGTLYPGGYAAELFKLENS